MRQKHPFLTRKGNGGFNRHTSPACKGDGGFTRETSGACGRWRDLAGLRDDAPSHRSVTQPHWCGGRRRVRRARVGLVGLAAVPVGGGRAWPGFETTRRAKLAARTTRGRAAAHGAARPARAHKAARPARAHKRPEHQRGHKQPGPHTARGPKRRSASRPSRVSVAHRLSWMLRPGTASISSRV